MSALKLKRSKPTKGPNTKLRVDSHEQIAPETGSVTHDSANLLLRTWQTEVDSLIDTQFVSISEAVDAVIKGVLRRMGSQISDSNDIESFLRALIATDPEMIETLYEILNIADRRDNEL